MRCSTAEPIAAITGATARLPLSAWSSAVIKNALAAWVARVAPDITKKTLHKIAREYILPKSIVFTDEHVGYDGFEHSGYVHKRIRHTAKVYVAGDIHTNTIEGFWSTVKRGIGGVYHNVSAKYLQDYLNEYCFRYNRRDQGNLIFNSILQRAFERAS
jgi:transposase